jgi:hypothetical protein
MRERNLVIPIPLELLPQEDDPPNVKRVKRALCICGFTSTEAASMLGISPVRFYRLLKHPMMGNWWDVARAFRKLNSFEKSTLVINQKNKGAKKPLIFLDHHYEMLMEDSKPEDFAYLLTKKKQKLKKPSPDVASKYVDLPLDSPM